MKLLAVVFLFLTSLAKANNCAQDAKKFCRGTEPGKGQLARCLSDYQGSLSAKCAKELAEYKKTTGKKNPCFEDLAEYCADLPSDPQNYAYCLLKHETKLSQACAEDFKKKKGKLITHDVCAQDIAENCYKEISGPEGAVSKCLFRNKQKFSGFCQKKVNKMMSEMRKKNACFDDTEKLCPNAVRFIDIQDCLSKKMTMLSKGCKKLVQNEDEKFKANPCYRDLMSHCRPGINPKAQDDCLTLNDEHLSNACKQFRVTEKTKVKKMVELCEADRLKLCKDAPLKDGAVARCLRSKKGQVSPACQKLL